MKISVITVSLNAQDLIEDTIQSVLKQTYKDFEIIVKDGLSTDDTLKRIPDDPRIRVISCKDRGIYQAMNQGIREATGDYLLFLNCGDLLTDEYVFEKVAAVVPDHTPAIIYGDYIQEGNRVFYSSTVTKMHFIDSSLMHQAAYFSRDVFEVVGMYDESMKISADWKCFLESKVKGVTFIKVDAPLCVFLEGGISQTGKGEMLGVAERQPVIKELFSPTELLLYRFLSSHVGQSMMRFRKKIMRR